MNVAEFDFARNLVAEQLLHALFEQQHAVVQPPVARRHSRVVLERSLERRLRAQPNKPL